MSKNKEIQLEGSFKALLDEKESESFESFEFLLGEELLDESAPDESVVQVQDEPDLEIESMPQGSDEATIIVDDVEIFQSFIQESQDHLENIEEKILKLEAEYDPDVVGDIFRSMHTMKGTSSYFGFEKIKELSHALESVLDDLRSEKIKISSELVDILLEGTDLLGRMIGVLGNSMSAVKGTGGTLEIPLPDIDINPILSRIQAGRLKRETNKDLVTDELIDKFLSEAMDLLDSTEKSILDLENRPGETESLDNAFRCIHTIKGNAGFMGYGDLEKICMETESVLDAIRQGERKVSPKVVTILLGSLDAMKKALDFSTIEEEGADQIETAESHKEEEGIKPLGEILVDIGAATPEDVDNALDIQDKKLGEILVAEGKVRENGLKAALNIQKKAISSAQAVSPAYEQERKEIRVDMRKLDKLFDLVGELITAEAMVIHNPELQELESESFNRATGYLGKITREMQEITMAVRMIPLEGLFNKMRRLVRDLSRKFGKKINLQISGQETEMDRNIIEAISDPLIHILRNSMDHGIEDTQERTDRGKDVIGTVALNAKYEGNEIWISIKDDGAGLNREKILSKAKERDLLKTDTEDMEDDELWQLIFEPGFSTAEKVSDVSGRGVGMDVVKKNIEKLRGKIDIKSATGQGTEIILKIPLTLAIIDGVTVRVGNILYALPLDDILEFHKATQKQITRTDTQREVLLLREELIPIVKLYNFFNSETEKPEATDGIMCITQANGKKMGLLVDEILGYQQIVVKALPEFLGYMRAISGCSILGSGEVSLIIDAGSLLKMELE